MAIQKLVDLHRVGRLRCASFALYRSSLVSLFSYFCRILRYYGFGYYDWTYGYCSTTGLRRLCREVVDQGHRPKERFFVLVLLGESELPGSCVLLPVWLMSQEFPEAESPAVFAALEGSARFQGHAQQGFSGYRCLPGLRDQHTEGAVPRTGRATLKDHHCGRVTRRDSFERQGSLFKFCYPQEAEPSRPPAWRSTRRPRWRLMRQKGSFEWFRLYLEGRV